VAASVLIADDEQLIRRSLSLALEAAGFATSQAESGAAARALISNEPPECIVLDLRLGDANGLDILAEVRRTLPKVKVVVITAHGSEEAAIQALKLGAFDFIKKPFDVEEVVATVRNALRTEQLEGQVAYLSGRAFGGDGELRHQSPQMAAALARLDRVAEQPVPVVLVTGESGSGKELAARRLHARSARASGPFIELNCSALPEQLVESELFGHERGAFSDAREQKKGLVELADGGTLFLDEVGDLPTAAQAKLLKFVESHEFRRVGGTRQLKVDCRIVAATHRDLSQSQSFRSDLYFRLSGVTLQLPPLREREGDVLLLARTFLAEFSREYRRPLPTLSREVEALLLRYRWPGNVRELRAAIANAVLMAERPRLEPEMFAQLLRQELLDATTLPENLDDVVPLAEWEERYFQKVLELCGGNKVQAAQKLGISRHTLARRLGEQS
jgi:two-component system response regulator AtoC